MRISKVFFIIAAIAAALSVFDLFPPIITGLGHAIAGSSFILFLITHIFGEGIAKESAEQGGAPKARH